MPITRKLTKAIGRSLASAVTEGGVTDPLARFDYLSGDWSGGDLAVRRNVWQYTEDLASNRYSLGGTSAKLTDTTTVATGATTITLTRMTTGNFFGSLRSDAGGLGLTPYVVGQRYLVSCFIKGTSEQFSWMRPLASGGSNGHGPKFIRNKPRRIWTVLQATTTSRLEPITTPTVELGGETGANNPHWLFQGNTEGGALDVYIGGFQIEQLASATYDDGVALIGDSTMAGASGGIDSSSTSAREVSTWAAALLNVNFFNRGVAGNTTAQMDARWATDITTIKGNCKYAMIQGGVNDFGNSVALATVQANVTSMVNKATTDGLIPILLTCTPSVGIVDVPADEANRLAFNAWLKATFANVIDIAAVVADSGNPSALAAAYAGDGTHYNAAAKKQIGIAIASWSGWAFTRPSPYQKVTAATYP